MSASFDEARALVGGDLDVDTLERWWREALALPEPSGPARVVARRPQAGQPARARRRLHAVIDFGGLSVGAPDAEHATIWDLPARARRAYWDELDLDDVTWTRARAWAIAVAAGGISYYWHTYPEFVAECRARLDAILAADARP